MSMLSRQAVLAGIAASIVAVPLVTQAARAAERYSSRCAAADLVVITVIDLYSRAGAIPAEKLSDAYLKVIDARKICSAARVKEALLLYDLILPGASETELGVVSAEILTMR
jgi:hypothetical protein